MCLEAGSELSLCECLCINSFSAQIFECLLCLALRVVLLFAAFFNSQVHIVLLSCPAPLWPVGTLSWGIYISHLCPAFSFLQDDLLDLLLISCASSTPRLPSSTHPFMVLMLSSDFIFLLIVICILEYMWHLESVAFWGLGDNKTLWPLLLVKSEKCATKN
jgi:hypothetical protein